MDDREFIFNYAPGSVPSFHDRDGNTYCAVAAFRHQDPDMFGTLVVAGSTPDHINVLIPDTVGPTVDAEGPVDLQHVVGLSLGPTTDLSSSLPPADLATSLCENSVVEWT